MAANKSTYAINATLNSLLAGSEYLALFVNDPAPSGSGTEVTGGSYARLPITWSTISANQKTNTAAINFTGLPATTINYWAIYDALTGGNLVYYGPLSQGVTVPVGGVFDVLANNLLIEEA